MSLFLIGSFFGFFFFGMGVAVADRFNRRAEQL
jgi:hypothetical protein